MAVATEPPTTAGDLGYARGVSETRPSSRSLALLATSDRTIAEETLAAERPWLDWLPEPERAECVAELLDHLAAGADTEVFVPFAHSLVAWQHTAEVWREPELARRLHGPLDTADAVELAPPDTGP